MAKKKRERWTEAQARVVLERMEKEGKSAVAMAEELEVKPGRIRWWKSYLKKKSRQLTDSETAFVEVEVGRRRVGGEENETSGKFSIRTHGGRKIEVWAGFDAGELRRLMTVVEGLPC